MKYFRRSCKSLSNSNSFIKSENAQLIKIKKMNKTPSIPPRSKEQHLLKKHKVQSCDTKQKEGERTALPPALFQKFNELSY